MSALKRRIAQYYLTLRLSASAVMPMFEPVEVTIPTPIIRRVSAELHDGWDRREIVQRNGVEFIVTRRASDAADWSMNLN